MPPILSFRYHNGDRKEGVIPVPIDSAIKTLDQAAALLPEGAYTTFRTYPNLTALHLNDHFHRLEESSRLAGYPVKLDCDQIRSNIRLALQQFHSELARVRVLIPFSNQGHDIYLFIGALTVPTEVQREHGVKVISREFHRQQPNAKLTGFISATRELRKILNGGIEEAIMVDEHKNILEGLTSNFYAVIDGIIYTAGEGVLPGITRQITLEIARSEGFKVILNTPSLQDVDRFSEAYITSSSRGVLPVTQIDARIIGRGRPGEITLILMKRFDQRVLAEVQPI